MKKILVILFIALAGGLIYLYMRPLPPLAPTSTIVSPPKTQAINLPWPASGQAAIGASGYGILETYNKANPVPIASVAKVIAGLAVLQKKPLAPGQQGPTITFDNTDLDYYNYYYTHDGSVAKVKVGEQISEYQALQTMLLPSSNNMADSLVRWAFGSTQAYAEYANKMVNAMGLKNTTVGGASGFADDTTSTAEDLVTLGIKAVQEPTLSKVVSQQTATVPEAGDIKSTNWLLGSDGVVGIKTGNTEKAGGCYLFATNRQINGRQITVVGAILGTSQLNDAILSSRNVIRALDSGFEQITIVHKGEKLGSYSAAWGGSTQLAAAKDLSLIVWKGKDIKIMNNLEPLNSPATKNSASGSVDVASSNQKATSALVLTNDMPSPSWHWRIFH